MNKCDCYYEKPYKCPVYGRYTGQIEYYEEQMIGYCYGTKECEQCSCNGNESQCTFYAEVRKRTKTERTETVDKQEIRLIKQFLIEHDLMREFVSWAERSEK